MLRLVSQKETLKAVHKRRL